MLFPRTLGFQRLSVGLLGSALFVLGCAQDPKHHDPASSSSSDPPSSSSAGKTATGGASATGGAPSTGGASATTAKSSVSSGGASGGSKSSAASGGAGGASSSSSRGPLIKAGIGTGGTPVSRNGQLSIAGNALVNSQGQPVQLKGPSSMWLNWESKPFAEDKAGVQWMRDNWHASVIRAAMGVDEPNGGNTYMANANQAKAQVNQIVQNAIDLGLYVIIDWHTSRAENYRSQAIQFFKEMASKWGNTPNVIYETYNEPLKVDWATVIKPYHQAVVDEIRKIDPDNIIILGTRDFSQEVDVAANDPVDGTNLMYALHFYSCSHKLPLRIKGDTALFSGAALFVSEWGATHADGGTSANPGLCLTDAQDWHTWMNENGISWAAWKFDIGSDKTCFFNSSAQTSGNWTDGMLNGHGPFVRDRMKE